MWAVSRRSPSVLKSKPGRMNRTWPSESNTSTHCCEGASHPKVLEKNPVRLGVSTAPPGLRRDRVQMIRERWTLRRGEEVVGQDEPSVLDRGAVRAAPST